MARQFKSPELEHSLQDYVAQMEAQLLAALLVHEFNRFNPEGTPRLRYNTLKTFKGRLAQSRRDSGANDGGTGDTASYTADCFDFV